MTNILKLKDLRSKGERSSLLFGFILALIILNYLYGVSILLTLVLVCGSIIYVKLANASLIGNSLLVTEKTIPYAHIIVEKYSRMLHIKQPDLFITQSPELNAFVLGITSPSVVITSSLFDILTNEELEFVIAHELGHIYFRHQILSTLFYPAGNQIPVYSYLFNFWSRKAELTADRVGLYCSSDLEPAVKALTKLGVGNKITNSIDVRNYITQAIEIDTIAESLGETLLNHPYTTKRITNLINFNKFLNVATTSEKTTTNE